MITYSISRESLKKRPYRCKKTVSKEDAPLNFDAIREILIEEIRTIVEEDNKDKKTDDLI